jgi:putative ABC transport system permease protein
MRNLFRYVGLRHLLRKPARSLLTTLGVAFGVALFVGIEIINHSTLSSFRESIDAVAGKTTLTISAGEMGFPEDRYEAIRAVPGVKHAVPMVESRAYFAGNHESSETLMVLGVDLLKEQSVRTYKTQDEQVIDDPLTFLNQPDSIIVTHAFAEAHKLAIDSRFELATARGSMRFTVRGLLSPEGPAKAYGGAIAIMDIDGARMTFGKEGKLDRVDVVTKAGEDIEAVAARLRSTLGPGYLVERPETQGETMERMVSSFQTMMTFFSTLALLVGLFLVTNSISIAVAERRREIGTLRALGATRAGILTLFLSEAVAMGAAGAFAGAWMGRGLASVLVGLVTRSMSTQYLTRIEVAHLQFGSSDVVRAVLLGAGAGFVAALWPSARASTIEPLEAMRGRDTDGSWSSVYRWFPWIGSAMLAYVGISSTLHFGVGSRVFQALGDGCAMLGSALVGPAIVAGFVRLTRPIAVPLGGTITRLAEDNLLRNPQRTGSNVMSLMIGLILVVLISAVNVSFRDTLSAWFDRILRADLLVSSTGRVISYQVQPLREELGRELLAVPGVKPPMDGSAYGLRFVHVQYQGHQIGMKAYDEPDADLHYTTIDARDRPAAEAGRELYHSPDPVVLVSENFVLHFGKKTGDTLDLETPSGLIHPRIAAVVNDFASAEGVLYISREQYKKYWKDPLVSAFGIQVLPGFDPQNVRAEIDRRLGRARNITVTSQAEIKRQMIATIDQSFAYTRAIELAALLVGLLGLLNTLLISVLERTRELGMLRAVGMERGQLRSMILQEALIQGSLGAVAAVALGSWIAYLWITHTLALVLGWMVDFHFPWAAVGATVLTGTGVALLAGLYPARRASQLQITEALEYE